MKDFFKSWGDEIIKSIPFAIAGLIGQLVALKYDYRSTEMLYWVIFIGCGVIVFFVLNVIYKFIFKRK